MVRFKASPRPKTLAKNGGGEPVAFWSYLCLRILLDWSTRPRHQGPKEQHNSVFVLSRMLKGVCTLMHHYKPSNVRMLVYLYKDLCA